MMLFFIFCNLSHAADSRSQLNRAVKAATEESAAEYDYVFEDLNGDGLKDAIILLTGWCGTGGCTMMIFKRNTTNSYSFVSRSTITETPIRVSPIKSNGWKSLIVHSKSLEGGFEALMMFDGESYPLNPSVQPSANEAQLEDAKKLDLKAENVHY
jgi:hypothetical protein